MAEEKLDEGTKSMMSGMGMDVGEVDESKIEKKNLKVDPGMMSMMQGMGMAEGEAPDQDTTVVEDTSGSDIDFSEVLALVIEGIKHKSPILCGILEEYKIEKELIEEYSAYMGVSVSTTVVESIKESGNKESVSKQDDLIEEFLDF